MTKGKHTPGRYLKILPCGYEVEVYDDKWLLKSYEGKEIEPGTIPSEAYGEAAAFLLGVLATKTERSDLADALEALLKGKSFGEPEPVEMALDALKKAGRR